MSDRNIEYEISLRDRITGKLNRINSTTKKTTTSFNALNYAIGAVSVTALFAGGKEAVLTAAKFDSLNKAIEFSSGTAYEASKNLEFLTSEAENLGINYEAMAAGFKTFSGAMRGSIFTAKQQRDMFLKVSKATKVMQLDADATKGTFLALGQIMSKGKVQAEELRGQIGERIPGAFQIAAKAMGMTTAELDKMMSEGKLMATDFIPKFANQLEVEFAGGVEDAVTSIGSSLAKAETYFDRALSNIGKAIHKSGYVDALANMLSEVDKFTTKQSAIEEFAKERGISRTTGLTSLFGVQTLTAQVEFERYKRMKKEFEKVVESLPEEDKGVELGKWALQNEIDIANLNSEYDKYLKKLEQGKVKEGEGSGIRKRLRDLEELRKQYQAFDLSNLSPAQDVNGTGAEIDKAKKKMAGVTITAASPKTFNINIDRMIENQNINTTNLTETASVIQETTEQALTRGLAQIEQVAR